MVELMLVSAVLAILITLGLPSLRDTISSISINSQAKTLVSSLNFARSEAAKRGSIVSVCGSASGTDCAADSWSSGWIVFVDNNLDADGAVGSVDAGDEVLRVYQASGANDFTFTESIQQYNSQGFSTNTATVTFLLCPEDGNSENAQSIEVSVTGRDRRIHQGLACS